MGSEAGFPAERPVHRAAVESYWISKYLITNTQYEQFVRSTGHRVPFLDDPRAAIDNWDVQQRMYPEGRARHPVVLVSWHDARSVLRVGRRAPADGGRVGTRSSWRAGRKALPVGERN